MERQLIDYVCFVQLAMLSDCHMFDSFNWYVRIYETVLTKKSRCVAFGNKVNHRDLPFCGY